MYRLTTLRITYRPGSRTNRDVNRLQYSYIIYFSENALHGPAPEQKMFRDQTEAMLFQPEQYQYPFWYYLY